MSIATDTQPLLRTVDGRDVPAAGTYDLDPSHTNVGFVARHLAVTKVRGRFTDVAGSITIGEDPLDSSVDVTIAMASVATGDENRDEHLRSEDFFDVHQHPHMTFRSTSVRHHRGDRYELVGDLSIKGVTREVVLDLEFEGGGDDPWGGQRIGFTAGTEIDREAWGLTWNQVLEAGGVLVGKKVKIEIDAQGVRS